MRWNTLQTELQREPFDDAGSMGALLDTATLRAQIAPAEAHEWPRRDGKFVSSILNDTIAYVATDIAAARGCDQQLRSKSVDALAMAICHAYVPARV